MINPDTVESDDVATAQWLAYAVMGDRRRFLAEVEHLGRNDLREVLYTLTRRTVGKIR